MKNMRIPTLLFAAGLAFVGCSNSGEAPQDNETPAPYEPEEPVPAETETN
jgi:PBP1b-binding outer membrane lipoprotein LpoB